MIIPGTNLFNSISAYTKSALTDDSGYGILVTCSGDPVSLATEASTYEIGCLCIRLDNGTLYQNTGSLATPTWTVNGTGASGTSGATGQSGYSGTSGFSGKSGTSGTSA